MKDNGFYWVKQYLNDEWTIGYFDQNHWNLLGTDEMYLDNDLAEIGNKVIMLTIQG